MSGYVIVRTDGCYVCRPGSEHAYTRMPENACVYPTLEEAKRNLCPGNERIVSVRDVLRRIAGALTGG